MFRKNRFSEIVNLEHHGEMRPDYVPIREIMQMTKIVDEALIGDGELWIAQCEEAHGAVSCSLE